MSELPLHDAFGKAKPSDPALSDAEVHVWAVPLGGDPAAYRDLMSAAELERLQRYRFADHQRRFQVGHGALRLILAGYLKVEPSTIEYRVGPRGKPYVVGHDLFFNLSHSGKLALIGVAKSELGLDVEKVRHLESLRQIAERHFSGAEFAKLDALKGSPQELAFYRCWTRKEAYIKALGEGLSMSLDSFDVSLDEAPKLVACHDGREDPDKWSMVDVSPGPDFVGAVAMRTAEIRLRCFAFDGPASGS